MGHIHLLSGFPTNGHPMHHGPLEQPGLVWGTQFILCLFPPKKWEVSPVVFPVQGVPLRGRIRIGRSKRSRSSTRLRRPPNPGPAGPSWLSWVGVPDIARGFRSCHPGKKMGVHEDGTRQGRVLLCLLCLLCLFCVCCVFGLKRSLIFAGILPQVLCSQKGE